MTPESAEREIIPSFKAGAVFIVGLPRSGTTLLYALLNQHPQIALMQEGELPLLWPLFIVRRSRSEWLERWNFFTGSLERHAMDLDRIPPAAQDIRSATEAAYKEYARQKGAGIWGDKCPSRFDSLDRLANQFPNSQFILIWRDPADVCRSIIRAQKESPFFSGIGATERVIIGYEKMRTQRDGLLRRGYAVHELCYTELVRNTACEMRRICDFLGIPFESRMVSLHGADRSALHPGDHNALVKTETISARAQPEVLPAGLKRKIDRYKHDWMEKGWETGMSSQPSERTGRKLSRFERIYDQFIYWILRGWDSAIVAVFCFAPLSLLRTYRAIKAGGRYMTWIDYVRARTSPTPPQQ